MIKPAIGGLEEGEFTQLCGGGIVDSCTTMIVIKKKP